MTEETFSDFAITLRFKAGMAEMEKASE